jgi:hypothetical protein
MTRSPFGADKYKSIRNEARQWKGYEDGDAPYVRIEIFPKENVDFLRKEVIQPQVPLRLPCYDFTPVADLTVADCLRS